MASKSYALVTGAASGMGRHYCLQLAKAGYGIIAVDINSEGLDKLAEELCDSEYVAICQNLTSADATQQIGSAVERIGAEVEVLVNNAGMIFTTAICDTAPAKLDSMMRLHCVTPLLLCREFVPKMRASLLPYSGRSTLPSSAFRTRSRGSCLQPGSWSAPKRLSHVLSRLRSGSAGVSLQA